jgi:hypothetical protein
MELRQNTSMSPSNAHFLKDRHSQCSINTRGTMMVLLFKSKRNAFSSMGISSISRICGIRIHAEIAQTMKLANVNFSS